jgi:hypothetical protein
MGGYNSGRHGGKRTTGDMHALDVRRLQRDKLLTPGESFGWTWSRNGNKLASINIKADTNSVTLSYCTKQEDGTWQDMDYPVRVERTACHLGGLRVWWLCPCCGRRVAVLYCGKMFACRQCLQLTYESTRTPELSKPFARADKMRRRLGWCAGIANPPGEKPKGMHWKTYLRLMQQLYSHSIAAMQIMNKRSKRLANKLDGMADMYE